MLSSRPRAPRILAMKPESSGWFFSSIKDTRAMEFPTFAPERIRSRDAVSISRAESASWGREPSGRGQWRGWDLPILLAHRLVGWKVRSGTYLARRKQWASGFFEPFTLGAFGSLGKHPSLLEKRPRGARVRLRT